MSETQRPTEWMPIAILGVAIIAVDLAIVGTELISPSTPKPANSSPATTTATRDRERPTSTEPPVSPRPAMIRTTPAAAEGPEGRPNGVPRFLPPSSPLAAPVPVNDPMPPPGSGGPGGLSPMPKPTMAPLSIGRLGGVVASDGGLPDAAVQQ